MSHFMLLMAFSILSLGNLWGQNLIIINGSSCSGKSSTSKILLKILKEDSLKEGNGERWSLESIDQRLVEMADNHKDLEKEVQSEWRHLPIHAQIFHGFHERIKRKVSKGENVLLDHCFMNESIFRNALYHFQDLPVFFVGLTTTHEEALLRLQKRNESGDPTEKRDSFCINQHYGQADLPSLVKIVSETKLPQKYGFPTHSKKNYDMSVDSTNKGIEEISHEIMHKFLRERSGLTKGNLFQKHRDTYITKASPKVYSRGSWVLEYDSSLPFLLKVDAGEYEKEYGKVPIPGGGY